MIFYYTGTGNSFMVARRIAYLSKERLVPITQEVRAGRHDYRLARGERLGFVFPTHCWGTPRYVDEFVDSAYFYDAHGNPANPYAFCVMTCGDSVGDALISFGKRLAAKGIALDSAWSVRMPDNYVIGFDAPTPRKAAALLEQARSEIAAIGTRVQARTPMTQFRRGIIGGIACRTNPSFKKSLGPTDEFYVTDACRSCGLCARLCTTGTITIASGKPVWHDDCEQCLACINCCPEHAIQYGPKKRKTEGRGRYMNPALKTEPLFVAAYENADINDDIDDYDILAAEDFDTDAAVSGNKEPLTPSDGKDTPKRLGWRTCTLYGDQPDIGEKVSSAPQGWATGTLAYQETKD